jgi:aldose 1-epimerase
LTGRAGAGAATGPLILDAGDARLTVSPADGGRIASLRIGGIELLVTEGAGPILWGSFPMAPFAGRVRHGRFRFGDRDVQLAINHPPHAIHGTVFQRSWLVTGPSSMSTDLGAGWPFRGRVSQSFELAPDGLGIRLVLEAEEVMPAALGWHPWFRRRLVGRDGSLSEPVELHFEPTKMYLRGADGLPTGELVDPVPGPWDDCFTGLRRPPRLTWPGVLGLEITSSCDHWVVYSEPADSICVEPQSEPPDFVNLRAGPTTAGPGSPLVATMTMRWSRLDAARRDGALG